MNLRPTSLVLPHGPWTIYSTTIDSSGRVFYTIGAGSNSDEDGPAELVAVIEAKSREIAELFCAAAPQRTKDENETFLDKMLTSAVERVPVTISDISLLKHLAGWADSVAPITWTGILNITETKKAVEAAKKRLKLPSE